MGKKYKIPVVAETSKTVCIVSDQVAVNGKPIGFMVKTPDMGDYSGWQFLSGQETEKYVSNPHTASVFYLEDIVRYDARVNEYLNSPDGTEIILS